MKVLDLINESNDRDFENPLPVDTQSNGIWDLSDEIINELLEQYKNKNDITFNKPDGAIDSTLLQKTIKDINRQVSTLEDVPINKILATEKYLVKSHLDSLVDGEGKPPLIYKSGDTYMVADGNHRVVAAYLQGKKTIKSLVQDLDRLAKQLNIK